MTQEILSSQHLNNDNHGSKKPEGILTSALETVLALFPEMVSEIPNFVQKLKNENATS